MVLSEETKVKLRELCKKIDEEKKGAPKSKKQKKTILEELEDISMDECIQELIRPIDGEEKINIEDLEIYDVAATPEEIAEEERKRNSYFNY